MDIELLYFAALRDAVGRGNERLSLPHDVRTVRELRAWIVARTPSLAGALPSVRFAVDESFVGDDDALHDGATVALIPPVSGG